VDSRTNLLLRVHNSSGLVRETYLKVLREYSSPVLLRSKEIETDIRSPFVDSPFSPLEPLLNFSHLHSIISQSLITTLCDNLSVNADGVPTYMGASGTALTWWITVAASAGFGLFGYDQGVMSGVF